jgi:hypothetical protein
LTFGFLGLVELPAIALFEVDRWFFLFKQCAIASRDLVLKEAIPLYSVSQISEIQT